MTTKATVFAAGIVAFILFLAFNGPGHARKASNPVGYWTKKRDTSTERVEFYRNAMGSCQLEFAKLQRTSYIIMCQAVLSGSTPQEARDKVLAQWEATKKECSIMRELLSVFEKELQYANQELAKHQ